MASARSREERIEDREAQLRVVSVFSFGLLAALASVVLGRWQRRDLS